MAMSRGTPQQRIPDNRPDDDVDDDAKEWGEHPRTKAIHRAFMAERGQAFEQLKRSCDGSTDPAVRAAFSKWVALVAVTAVTGKGYTGKGTVES